jgi:hypothetical protein
VDVRNASLLVLVEKRRVPDVVPHLAAGHREHEGLGKKKELQTVVNNHEMRGRMKHARWSRRGTLELSLSLYSPVRRVPTWRGCRGNPSYFGAGTTALRRRPPTSWGRWSRSSSADERPWSVEWSEKK